MFEVDDVMRFHFALVVVLIAFAVLNELPQTFALVLINNRGSLFIGLLDRRSIFHILPSHITLLCLPLVFNCTVQVYC